MNKDLQIQALRAALKPFTDNKADGRLQPRPEDFDHAKQVYEETAPEAPIVDWFQRAVDAEEMLREVLEDYNKRYPKPVTATHRLVARFVESLDVEYPRVEGSSTLAREVEIAAVAAELREAGFDGWANRLEQAGSAK